MNAATNQIPRRFRRIAIEIAILAALGAMMGVLGPYDTGEVSAARRFFYWLSAIIGGGGIGIAIDWFSRGIIGSTPRRVVSISSR
jgi:uncharacterized YccA/Bax inhibitor family protein